MPLEGTALGFLNGPDDLFIEAYGTPVRLDKAFSWEHPLAIHGMLPNAITNARPAYPDLPEPGSAFMPAKARTSPR